MSLPPPRVGVLILVFIMSLLLCISAPCLHNPASAVIGFSHSDKYNTDGQDTRRLSSLDTTSAAFDFGRIYHHKPAAILQPSSAEEIARFLRAIYASRTPSHHQEYLTVAAKGAGHSIHGQAQAPDGLVIEMSSLRGIRIHETGDANDYSYADVAAGELWVDLLTETMKLGLAPRSWTDYLYLSVGGTLSNAGISGQTFRYGPQISNVLQLDIITGTGELVTCSPAENADIFYASMGGLGQFGVITRARIILEPAPHKVKWVRALYSDFEQFTRDQELLVSMDDGAAIVDYLEGFVVVNNEAMHSWSISFPSATPLNDTVFNDAGTEIFFCIEIAKYFTQEVDDETADVDKVMGRIISRLSFIPRLIYSVEVPYVDFLNRVRVEESNLRSRGLWDVPHPWLNMFVPRRQIQHFTTSLLKIMSPDTVKGPILVYPVNRSKWNTNMSAVIPEDKDEIFYAVGVLRSADPQCLAGSSCLNDLLSQNQQIIDLSTNAGKITSDKTDSGMGAKQYLAHHSNEWQWKNHFGSKWEIFLERKARYDPLNILAPGQRILKRNRA